MQKTTLRFQLFHYTVRNDVVSARDHLALKAECFGLFCVKPPF